MWVIVGIAIIVGTVLILQTSPKTYTATLFFSEKYTVTSRRPQWTSVVGCGNLPSSIPCCDWSHLSPSEFAVLLHFLTRFTDIFSVASEKMSETGDAHEFAVHCCREAQKRKDVHIFSAVTAAFLVCHNPHFNKPNTTVLKAANKTITNIINSN